MSRGRKHLDFELNLIPCIDLLSVCICFLLLTAVWLQVGSLNVKQAIGGQPSAQAEKSPELWVSIGNGGDLTLNLKQTDKVPGKLRSVSIKGVSGQMNTEALNQTVSQMRGAEPELKMVLIQPQMQTEYDQIIGLMDEFKKTGLTDLGVVPL